MTPTAFELNCIPGRCPYMNCTPVQPPRTDTRTHTHTPTLPQPDLDLLPSPCWQLFLLPTDTSEFMSSLVPAHISGLPSLVTSNGPILSYYPPHPTEFLSSHRITRVMVHSRSPSGCPKHPPPSLSVVIHLSTEAGRKEGH